jgi:Peptidase family M48
VTRRHTALLLVAAAVWAVAAWLFWRSSLPALHLPQLDEHALFPSHVLHRAQSYSGGARFIWLAQVVTQLVVLGLFARYGIRWMRESAAGPIGTGMLLGMIGFALVWAAELPFSVLDVWWRHHYGLSGSYVQATIGNWFALGAQFVLLCAALLIVMGLARRRSIGDLWWLPAVPVFVGLRIVLAFIAPWLLGGSAFHKPYVAHLERIEHVHVPVRVLSGFSEPNAFATGLGASRRVFLWRPIIEPPFTPRMDRFVLAHELGHLAHNHIWKSIGWYTLFALPLAFLIARATRGRGGMGVAEAVPLAIFVYVVFQLATLPLQNVVTRHLEAEADWSALRATHDPGAGRQLFRLFGSETLEDPNPPWWDYVLLRNHPTLMQRIEMTQAYAAAQSP